MSDYQRIATAIRFLGERVSTQPGLDELARHVHLSPFHFQRLFCRWAGISPKKMLQVLTVERGKALLERSQPLLQVSEELGLSSSSRLHDHFIALEAMTPGEFKAGGKQLVISWGVHNTPFGAMFIAATQRGVCQADFLEQNALDTDIDSALARLDARLPHATMHEDHDATRRYAQGMFPGSFPVVSAKQSSTLPIPETSNPESITVKVQGSSFQIAVWRALLQIPAGSVSSYAQIAAAIGRPGSVRAVGNAIAANPVAMLIPCHRVIRHSGALGGYRWGPPRKQMIQLWERAQTL